ncbi:MAG: DUF177 domain-containing protein [Vampirovibrionales bacterium]|nr:DUF177 domain-containing protein [Vampirovibrionales bacterium]
MYDDISAFVDEPDKAPLPWTVMIEDWLQALEGLKREQLRLDRTQKDRPTPALPLNGIYTYEATDIMGPSLPAGAGEVAALVTVIVALLLHHQGMQLRLHGTLEATLPFVCDRCLAPFETTVAAHPDELFLLLTQLPKSYQQEEWVAQYSDESDAFGPDDTFDLRDWVRQWIVLESAGQHWCSDCG